MTQPSKTVVVLGGGVIGCTTALILAEKGYDVAIVARDLPTDALSQSFASPWAGANWHPFNGSTDQVKRWETMSYPKLKELGKLGLTSPLKWIDYSLDPESDNSWVNDAFYNSFIPDHKITPKNQLPKQYFSGSSLTTLSLAPPVYLKYLYDQLKAKNVRFIRKKVESIDEAARVLGEKAGCVVNATGLGALSLGGVFDQNVVPIRGQTVLVKAPWLKNGLGVDGFEDGTFTYIIPRPDGNAILGGTMTYNSWDTSVDPEIADRILRNAFKVMPELSKTGKFDGIQVVSHNVGLRPGRNGGPRLELETLRLPRQGSLGMSDPTWVPGGNDVETVGVVHAYGIGPAGYQASWGMAQDASDLVDKYFRTLKEQNGKSLRRESKL
ncbi:D-aspartate oxidase [Phaffia rhodozyma]|uniref:D-aspartate oxidase n=1 Tax=Phaffia rhodozyma TaxID=264483 RepID=A0A0F7SW68_PHARH|nr:D-aspartate oxidase [Phaffia rhodozyma]